jgi:hypothetical protein
VKQDLVLSYILLYNPASQCAVKQKPLSYSFRGRVEMHIMEYVGANLIDKINKRILGTNFKSFKLLKGRQKAYVSWIMNKNQLE